VQVVRPGEFGDGLATGIEGRKRFRAGLGGGRFGPDNRAFALGHPSDTGGLFVHSPRIARKITELSCTQMSA
jgi:hypothetical protein